MIKKLRVAVDHGNRNMKTCNFIFTTGITVLDKKPARDQEYLKYGEKCYILSEQRIPYQRDKTQDHRFWILTLFAIAKEMKAKTEISPDDVVQIVEGMVQDYVTDLLNSIRERNVDTKSSYTIFIGGGAILLRRFIEKYDRLGKCMFIDDVCANAKGYDALYRAYKNRK